MQLVYPFIDKEPNMVLIEACKGGNSRIRVERPLVVYERLGFIRRMFWSCIGWCDVVGCSGRFWAIPALRWMAGR